MGIEEVGEMKFWTKEEYLTFSRAMMNKEDSYHAFEILYWCGIRLGELLALTAEDFDFEKKTLRINKSYQRIKGKDVITTPKTRKSNRVLTLPDFLADEMQDYISRLPYLKIDDRIFTITKSGLHHEMERECRETGVKRIRIHDLRHSHVSMLIEMGFSAVDITNRIGHESVKVTYRYAHMFPNKDLMITKKLNISRNGEKDEQENLDQKGRLRNKIISFRMSKEEAELLDRRVLMSGLTKQDFIVNSLLGKEIAVYGNSYVFRSLQDEHIRFINLYGTKIDNDADDEMITLALRTILAMRKKGKTEVFIG